MSEATIILLDLSGNRFKHLRGWKLEWTNNNIGCWIWVKLFFAIDDRIEQGRIDNCRILHNSILYLFFFIGGGLCYSIRHTYQNPLSSSIYYQLKTDKGKHLSVIQLTSGYSKICKANEHVVVVSVTNTFCVALLIFSLYAVLLNIRFFEVPRIPDQTADWNQSVFPRINQEPIIHNKWSRDNDQRPMI